MSTSEQQETTAAAPRFKRSFETQQLVQRLEKADVGDVIPYNELSAVAGERIEGASSSLVTARRVMQNEYGRVFLCVPGVGVKRASADEIVKTGSQTVTHIHRTARRGLVRLGLADPAELTDEAKREFNEKASHLALLEHVTGRKAAKRLAAAVTETQAKLPVQKTLEAFQQ